MEPGFCSGTPCSSPFPRWPRDAVAPAGATTLIRQGLDELVAGNRAIVVGEVVDARSFLERGQLHDQDPAAAVRLS